MKRVFHNRALFIYIGFALLVFAPLLRPGYIQTLDMPWGPRPAKAGITANYWLVIESLHLIGDVISQMIVQKVLLLSIFILAGYGMHRLFMNSALGQRLPAGGYLAGLLYVCNPFVYTRLMAGQWLVLLGYAALPWALDSLWRLMQRPGWRPALLAFVWTSVIGLTSIHAVGFVLLATLLFFMTAGGQNIARRLKWCAAVGFGWLIVNALWLIPLILGRSGNALQISGFGPGQFHAFASSGSVFGSVPLSTLLLQGFWADPQGRYYLPSQLGWWWGIIVGILAFMIGVGFITAVRRRDRLAIALAVAAVIAWWLAMGIGSSWSAGTATFLAAHVPQYRGYREPQKWLMLLALAYSYFAAVGAGQIIANCKMHKPQLQTSLRYGFLFLPLLVTPMLLWGAGSQLTSGRYPAGWQQVAQTLDANNGDYQVLVLPWHIYLPVSFAGRVVANPAARYFKQPVVISDNPELTGVPPAQDTALYRHIDNVLLPQRTVRTDAGKQLSQFHIKYVILLHEADWQQYGWIRHQDDLQLVQRTASISLYRVHVTEDH